MADVKKQGKVQDWTPPAGQKGKQPEPVQKYDFTAPKKFSGNSLGLLDSIYTGYARQLETLLAGLLRLGCEVRLEGVKEQKYGEFSAPLASNDVLAIAEMALVDEAKQPPAMLHMDVGLALGIMDRLLGGPGRAPEGRFDGYTDVELELYKKICGYLIPPMNDAWQAFFNVGFAHSMVKHNPKLMQDVAPSDNAVVVSVRVSLQDAGGTIRVALPATALAILFRGMEDAKRTPAKSGNFAAQQAIFANLAGSVLEVSAKLDETEITLRELMALRVGDVINLDKPTDSEALLCVEDVPWFTGELGVHKQRMALKVSGPISAAEEDV